MRKDVRAGPGETHRRGRPSKFGRPSRLVAVTLPEDVVDGLREVHPDLARAIVTTFEKGRPSGAQNGNGGPAHGHPELVGIGDRNALIIVNRLPLKTLPGIDLVPFADGRAFLALEPGAGLADLEAAVLERLERARERSPERRALAQFRRQLRAWRRDRSLRFHSRAIIVVERVRKPGHRAREL